MMPESLEMPFLRLPIAVKCQLCAPGTTLQLSLTPTAELPSTQPIFSSQAAEAVERSGGLWSLRLVTDYHQHVLSAELLHSSLDSS